MIKNIYETHLHVRDIERAIDFYQNKLGLKLARRLPERKVVFFWIGEDRQQMLGLWEKPKNATIQLNHFAFGVELEFLKRSKTWLEDRGIEVIGSQGKGNEEPIVQSWMPTASVYFLDYDGNKLEFISLLSNEPNELGYVPYLSEWEKDLENKKV
ncbi:VOC family protein [Bacillus cytotoxicus]|uniref:VOC family protein n=1 Tax=Bacillus cytotoxicus TaxID=580165 RepID=A0ACC6AC53_9BACI|nr:VOC family protein [Bacillus cytotoxicus]